MICTILCLAHLGICWVFPLIKTVESVKSQKFDSLWLSYWLIFGLTVYVETNLIWFLCSNCVYDSLKSVFCLWMLHQDYRGAEWIEENVFAKAFSAMDELVDKTPLKSILK